MTRPYLHYAWEISYYSGKTRAYLRYKQIPFVDKKIHLWTMPAIQKKVGAHVMPVLVTPQGEWLQDTSHIIDVLEQRFPDAPIVPTTPRQKMAAYLIEAWADEYWLTSAMHYRWSYSENFTNLFQPEVGDNLLPFFPRFIKNRAVTRVAKLLRSYLPSVGVVAGQHESIERWTLEQLDALDKHFSEHDYLLGSKPCIGDFGLIGPLYAHLGRDPYPARELIGKRPNLQAWVQRMMHPQPSKAGNFLADDAIPETLLPLFKSVFADFWPQIKLTLAEMQRTQAELKPGRGWARMLGMINVPMAAATLLIGARPFSVWMAQRAIDTFRALPSTEQASVQTWLTGLGAEDAMALEIKPRLRQVALRVAPE
jgi:glutathione S-transferase